MLLPQYAWIKNQGNIYKCQQKRIYWYTITSIFEQGIRGEEVN